MNKPSYSKDYLEPNSPLVRPVHIFLNHTYVMHLTKQNRSEDADHSAYLNRLWNGEKILLPDIKNLYSKFDPANDLRNSMDWMEKGVVLVTKNLERILFTIQMAKLMQFDTTCLWLDGSSLLNVLKRQVIFSKKTSISGLKLQNTMILYTNIG